MFWWLIALIYLGSMVVGELLKPKPKSDIPKASALGDFTFPTAEEGRPIPLAYGRVKITGPNVTWYGDLKVDTLTRKVKTGIFTHTHVFVNHKYYLGMQIAICAGPIDDLIALRFDDKLPLYTKTPTAYGCQLVINDPNLFGGNEEEGGVVGTVDVYYGSNTQDPNDYLETVTGDTLPGYRGTAYAVLRQCYIGTRNVVPAVSFEVSKLPNSLGLGSGKEHIGYDANPACVIYDLMTETRHACGIGTGSIDTTSFQDAGSTLYDEDAGISLTVDREASGEEVIADILRHIDGVIYPDPLTGKLTLALARDDYTVGDLEQLDESNVVSCEMSRGSWADTKNIVKVNYIDRDWNYTTRTVQVQNQGNIQSRSGIQSVETIDFLGSCTKGTAKNIAARACKTLSYPFATVHLQTNRVLWDLQPGGVFRLTWPDFGIDDVVYRVTRIGYGHLTDGKIDIDAVEDIFFVTGDYFTPDDPDWEDPGEDIAQPAAVRLWIPPIELSEADPVVVWTLVVRSGVQELGYEVWSNEPVGGNDNWSQTWDEKEFTPGAQVKIGIDDNDLSMTVDGTHDFGRLEDASTTEVDGGLNIFLLDDELIGFETVSEGLLGVWTLGGLHRGMFGTTAASHLADAWLYVVSDGHGQTREAPYQDGDHVEVEILPYNRRGITDLHSGPSYEMDIGTGAGDPGAAVPYPPTNLRCTNQAGVIVGKWDKPASYSDLVSEYEFRISRTAPAESGGLYTMTDYQFVRVSGAETTASIAADVGNAWYYCGVVAINEAGKSTLCVLMEECD